MPGKIRVDYEGAIHHVICRGNNGAYIFQRNRDKDKYLELMVKYADKFDIKLLAYCIMDNHVHLMVQSGDKHIGLFMHGLQLAYSKWYHRCNHTFGQVFSGRYKNFRCEQRAYYLHVLRYLHFNPLKAGMTQNCSYRYSSYDAYLTGNGIIHFKYAYGLLGDHAIEVFLQLMNRTDDDELLEAIDIVSDVRASHEEKLCFFFKLLNYDLSLFQGVNIDPLLVVLRKKIIRLLHLTLHMKMKKLAYVFKVSEAYLYGLLK